MADTSDFKNGLVFKHKNNLVKITEFLHVKPGKGPAFVRTKLKSVTTGKVIENTFSAGHKIEDVRVETHKFQFLYNDGEFYHFMNTEDYTQIRLMESALDSPGLMKEGEVVTVIINSEDNSPLSVEMPPSVILEVTHEQLTAHDGREKLTRAIKDHVNEWLVEEKDMFPGITSVFLTNLNIV